MNKTILITIILAGALILGYFFMIDRGAEEMLKEVDQVAEEVTGDIFIVEYTDEGYFPQSLTLKKGDAVRFVNLSEKEMWPASAMHPTHAVYPTTGGCIASTFDACKGFAKGTYWDFVFNIAGDWKYHDHIDATKFGSIKVSE